MTCDLSLYGDLSACDLKLGCLKVQRLKTIAPV